MKITIDTTPEEDAAILSATKEDTQTYFARVVPAHIANCVLRAKQIRVLEAELDSRILEVGLDDAELEAVIVAHEVTKAAKVAAAAAAKDAAEAAKVAAAAAAKDAAEAQAKALAEAAAEP